VRNVGSNVPQLLQRYTSLEDRPLLNIIDPEIQQPQSFQHLGQMNGEYGLSSSQRKALYHFFSLGSSEILAINGPPGTGKTTLLQSVIASLWIQQALHEDFPPIIVASSANNQAVTNIMQSFEQEGDNSLMQRWLPDVNSHGLYLCSKSKSEEAQKSNFQFSTVGRSGFIKKIEDPSYLKQANRYFLEKFNTLTKQSATRVASARQWLHQQLVDLINRIRATTPTTSKMELELDRQRCHAFWLATHYWEARWLAEVSISSKSSKVSGYTLQDWYRLAMVTPCFVSTFYMVPRFFQVNKEPCWDFIDLLIVDEAGQVAPDIAGATFALAKQALVVGDVHQIEPVWSITTNIDRSNLRRYQLAVDEEGEEEFSCTGLSSANGSVMKIAQRASCYQQYSEQRGMFLSEHRRCLPDIINFCNELSYQHCLEPMRSSLATEQIPKLQNGFLLPPLGYLFIDGRAEKENENGSPFNKKEADTIARWLLKQHDALIEHYDHKPLSEIVAVISPFTAQKKVIRAALQDPRTCDITVGTVHALQGAERPIVIFSPVYDSTQKKAFFFDKKPNLLNVAVSRAKDSFLVFGDMRIFNPKDSNYSSLLARHLFRRPENSLPKDV
jgi:superfamily I DNA and/or RNA helicase